MFWDVVTQLFAASGVTIRVTLVAGALCLPLAFGAALARMSRRLVIRLPAACFIEVFRGTSFIVQLFWVYLVLPRFGVSLTAFTTGVVVLALNVGAYGSEVVRGAVETVPKGQFDAAIAMGMRPRMSMARVILPQAVPLMVPAFGNLLVQLLKATAVLSLITLTEITFEAQVLRSISGNTALVFGASLVVYFVLAQTIMLGRGALERRIARQRRLHPSTAGTSALDPDLATAA